MHACDVQSHQQCGNRAVQSVPTPPPHALSLLLNLNISVTLPACTLSTSRSCGRAGAHITWGRALQTAAVPARCCAPWGRRQPRRAPNRGSPAQRWRIAPVTLRASPSAHCGMDAPRRTTARRYPERRCVRDAHDCERGGASGHPRDGVARAQETAPRCGRRWPAHLKLNLRKARRLLTMRMRSSPFRHFHSAMVSLRAPLSTSAWRTARALPHLRSACSGAATGCSCVVAVRSPRGVYVRR
jgi:hypothetical protein